MFPGEKQPWSSLDPRPGEEEKGPGFSHSHMRLIITDFSMCPSVGGC